MAKGDHVTRERSIVCIDSAHVSWFQYYLWPHPLEACTSVKPLKVLAFIHHMFVRFVALAQVAAEDAFT